MNDYRKRITAFFLSLCMIFGMVLLPAKQTAAETSDNNVTLPEPVFEVANPQNGQIRTGMSNLSTVFVNITYRLKEASGVKMTLLTFGNSAELYLDAASGKAGIESEGLKAEVTVSNTALNAIKWHNLAVSLSDGVLEVFVDGASAGTTEFNGTLDTASIQCSANAFYSKLKLYDQELSEEEILELHSATSSVSYPDGTDKLDGYEKTPNREVFNSGFDGSVAYRIPSIVTSKKTGTVFVAIDKRWEGSGDVGVIDNVIRRSEDNGNTWGPVIPVIDLANNRGYTMDASMVVDNQEDSEHYGRIYMMVDMFRDGVSLWGAQPGTGYTKIGDQYYQTLTDKDGNSYTVREGGVVYDSDGEVTAYQVETEAEAPYNRQGTLFKDGEEIGSIYKGAELTMYNTCYLWMTYSDDDGLTWSLPKDITPYVKADWMTFFGLGPGAGVQLQSGRLMFTTYCMDAKNSVDRFSSFNVYSDDDGETWHRGASPNDRSETENAENSTRQLNESCIVELNNGHLIQFMKNSSPEVAMAVSKTQGESWEDVTYAKGVKEPYCEMSAVHYPEKILDPRDGQKKEAIFFSNPGPDKNIYTGNGREYGTVRIAFVNEDDTLDWAYRKPIEVNKYLYTSLTVMNNGNIGLIYEHEGYAMVGAAFTSFSPEYIMDENVHENTPTPTGITTKIVDGNGDEMPTMEAGNKVEIAVDFSQNVFASGNVALEVKVGDKVNEAVLAGNEDADTLKFVYEIGENDSGTAVVTGNVRIKEGGVAETVYNVSLTDKPIVTKDVEIGRIGADSYLTGDMTAEAGSAHSSSPASNVLDGQDDTFWHSLYDADNVSNGGRPKHWITVSLGGEYLVTGLSYLPRQDSINGSVTKYQIETSTNGTDFTPVAIGNWNRDKNRKTAYLDGAVLASHVKFRVLETGDEWATAAEINIIGTSDTDAAADKKELLNKLYKIAALGENLKYIKDMGNLDAAIQAAKETAAKKKASRTEINTAVQNLDSEISSALNSAKANLQTAVNRGKARSPKDYNITTWAVYQKALKAAEQITDSSSDEDALTAYMDLLAAEDALSFSSEGEQKHKVLEEAKADAKSALEQADKELKADDYTKESWDNYQKAYNTLKNAVVNATDAEEINRYTKALRDAITSLVKKQNITPPLTPDNTNQDELTGIQLNQTYTTSDKLKYKVTNVEKKTVSLIGTENKKKITSLTVKDKVEIEGVSCTVTEIGAKAFYNYKKLKSVTIGKNVVKIGKQAFMGCKQLKTIKFKGKLLSKVGKNAWKGISKKAVMNVPKAKKRDYKKLLAKKGQPKSVKIK